MTAYDEAIAHEATCLVREATAAGVCCACAESCTGGLVSGAITAISGSSSVLRGGVVSYAIEVKHDVLGVDAAILDDPSLGAVSAPCAEQMAAGARRLLKADVAVSVTGIAGPTGAEPAKPVGTVWFGLCVGGTTRSELCHFDGSRGAVRQQAVVHALGLLREGTAELSGADAQG